MDIPKTEHFAVVYADSIYIPGDERSRTNPGHGYGESYEMRQVYKAFKSQAELESWIASNSRHQFVVLKSQPLSVSTTTSYSFS
ncbi:hypothetical protein G6L37_05135 [Agrobacterium rubi]|nr:hypothetical protein [Agrobacterium rubi]NTF24740.1 hypothetical protein [Agrobacterium rubi]